MNSINFTFSDPFALVIYLFSVAYVGCCTCALQTICCMVFVVVIICLAIGLGVYFGIFHNRDSDSDTTTPRSLILNALMPDGFHEEKESTWVY